MLDRWRSTFGGLYVELAILVFCGLILSETGQTKGPVFDAIGPDVLPTAVALIVAGLTLLQVVVQIARGGHALPDADPRIMAPELLRGLIFAAVTIAYVVVLASRLVPFWLATAVFVAVTTLIMARPPNGRDAILGAVIGVILGAGLQFVFTTILVIDLPT